MTIQSYCQHLPIPRVKEIPNVNYGLWMVVICQYRFNNSTDAVMTDVRKRCEGIWGIWEISSYKLNFAMHLKACSKKYSCSGIESYYVNKKNHKEMIAQTPILDLSSNPISPLPRYTTLWK